MVSRFEKPGHLALLLVMFVSDTTRLGQVRTWPDLSSSPWRLVRNSCEMSSEALYQLLMFVFFFVCYTVSRRAIMLFSSITVKFDGLTPGGVSAMSSMCVQEYSGPSPLVPSLPSDANMGFRSRHINVRVSLALSRIR